MYQQPPPQQPALRGAFQTSDTMLRASAAAKTQQRTHCSTISMYTSPLRSPSLVALSFVALPHQAQTCKSVGMVFVHTTSCYAGLPVSCLVA